ncbi:MAG: 3-ketoacyl-ACP reductase [Cyclobacteriaceae bacterium]|nr:3-ketoacyl-ACP reductase [Cyclobacteriaceae bacterium]
MKTALITGGTRGIGFGIATCLAREGFDVAVNGVRDESEVKEALEKLRSFGTKVIYCQGDISKQASRTAIISKMKMEFGQLNVLVNNAGVAPKERNDILVATEESFDYVMGTNLKGTYFFTQEAANWMVQQKKQLVDFKACIINVTSVSSTVASVNRGEYCIAKAGLSMVTRLYAARLGEFDIPVFEIQPGVIHTDMTSGVQEKYDKLFSEGMAIQQRWGLPADVGKAVAALARGDFPYSTGQVIMVDGGMTLQRL